MPGPPLRDDSPHPAPPEHLSRSALRAGVFGEIPGRVAGSHIRLWLAAVLAAAVLGTAGYMLIDRWSLSDAVYMTVISLTTVGFKEVRELTDAGRIWTMLLSISGVGLLFGMVGIVGESVIGEATSGRRQARKMQGEVDRLRGHFVLCGYGRVGSAVAEQLGESGNRFVVVDLDEDSLERARADGHLVVAGDATEDETLVRAGIREARGLITTIDSDALNVYVILSARAMNAEMLIVGRASTAGAEAKLSQAGADRVVSPYAMAGRRLAELAVRPRVVDFIDAALERGEAAFSLEEVEVADESPLNGQTVGALRERGIFVIALPRYDGSYEPNPPDDRRFRPGDSLIVSGSVEALAALHAP